MISSVANIIVSVGVSLSNLTENSACNQIADISNLNAQELVAEIQSDYCIDNQPEVFTWDINEKFISQNNIDNYPLLK